MTADSLLSDVVVVPARSPGDGGPSGSTRSPPSGCSTSWTKTSPAASRRRGPWPRWATASGSTPSTARRSTCSVWHWRPRRRQGQQGRAMARLGGTSSGGSQPPWGGRQGGRGGRPAPDGVSGAWAPRRPVPGQELAGAGGARRAQPPRRPSPYDGPCWPPLALPQPRWRHWWGGPGHSRQPRRASLAFSPPTRRFSFICAIGRIDPTTRLTEVWFDARLRVCKVVIILLIWAVKSVEHVLWVVDLACEICLKKISIIVEIEVTPSH